MNKKKYISVSVMCSDLMALGSDIKELERLGVDMLHVDVTDAHFVPNLTFGSGFIKAMHACTRMPLDIHLMVEEPEVCLQNFSLREGDILTAHVELDRSYDALAAQVHKAGCRFGLALNPETPLCSLERHEGLFDVVLLMLVHPGFAGAKLVDGILDKVALTRRWLDEHGLQDVEISVDGSVSAERASLMAQTGASIFVGGTAGIYRPGMALEETVPAFREAISAPLV